MKRNILFVFVTVAISITLSSYHNGAAFLGLVDCTGAEKLNPKGCSNGSLGCHSTNALDSIGVKIEMDSAGIPVKGYIPGHTYQVKIVGTNNSFKKLPVFGFQLTCIKGDTSASIATNAGNWDTTNLPVNTQFTPNWPGVFDVNIMEQNDRIAATSGTGHYGTIYSETFNWTAPSTYIGKISFWGVINASNGDTHIGGDFWNTDSLVLDLAKPDSTADTSHHANGIYTMPSTPAINIFPNPFIDKVFVEGLTNSNDGNIILSLYDLSGKLILTRKIEYNLLDKSTIIDFNSVSLSSGVYLLNFSSKDFSFSKKLIKVD